MGIVGSRKWKIIRKKIISQKLLEVKESTSVEGPTNCNAATSTTRQCNNNDKYNNTIKETLARSGYKRKGRLKLVINLTLVI